MPLIDGKQIRDSSIDGDDKLTSAFLVSLIRANGANDFSNDQSMGGNKLTNVGAPVSDFDAARKYDLDQLRIGLRWKAPVYVATTGDIALYGLQMIDGYNVHVGNRVLVKDQIHCEENGIYDVSVGTWVRSDDASIPDGLKGAAVLVEAGALNADTLWTQTNDNVCLSFSSSSSSSSSGDCDPCITWVKFGTSSNYVFRNGLNQSGNNVDVVPGDASLTSTAGSLTVRKSANGAVVLDGTNGLAVNTGPGVTIVANALTVKLNATSGLTKILGTGLDELSVSATNDSIKVGTGLTAAVPVSVNKNMASLVTVVDFDPACNTTITGTPGGDGYVQVLINGVQVVVGDAVRTQECYFSVDNGATPRSIAAIAAGDKLFWVGSVAGYQLAATDRIDFNYTVAA